jgi:hypothetical protein
MSGLCAMPRHRRLQAEYRTRFLRAILEAAICPGTGPCRPCATWNFVRFSNGTFAMFARRDRAAPKGDALRCGPPPGLTITRPCFARTSCRVCLARKDHLRQLRLAQRIGDRFLSISIVSTSRTFSIAML